MGRFTFGKNKKIKRVNHDQILQVPAVKKPTSLRAKIIEELVQTEAEFVFLMTMAVHYHVAYITNKLQGKKPGKKWLQAMPQDLLDRCFGTFTELTEKHNDFCTSLKNVWTHWSENAQVGNLLKDFLNDEEMTNLYLTYARDKLVAGEQIDKSYEDHKKVMQKIDSEMMKQIKKNKEPLPPGITLKTRDLVQLPAQRLSRYGILLGKLVRATSESHVDYQHIVEAHQSAKSLVARVKDGGRSTSSNFVLVFNRPSTSQRNDSLANQTKPASLKRSRNSQITNAEIPNKKFRY